MDMCESLFSLEVRIESVNRLNVSCVIPAVSFRLLDFPTLVIHYVNPANLIKLREKAKVQGITKEHIESEFRDRYNNIQFSKGKSCLFKANIDILHRQLQVTPLYVMLLDVWPAKPKLVGSTMIPLRSTLDKIAADVKKNGISVPSICQQEGTYQVFNLMGSVIGNIHLALRVLSLGGSLTPHIPTKSIMTRESAVKMDSNGQNSEEIILEDLEEKSLEESPITQPLAAPLVQTAATQTTVSVPKAHKSVVTTMPPNMEDTMNEPTIIANTVCPPPLFYHFKAHAENSVNNNEKMKLKEGKDRNDNHNYDVDFTYYKPDLVQPDGSCGCVSVCIQTEGVQDNSTSSLQITNDKPEHHEKAHHNQINSDEIPLLSALLEELTYLRTNRVDITREVGSEKPTAETVTTHSKDPPKGKPKVRECCAEVMAQKSGLKKTTKTFFAPKRVKFKKTSLTHGMTRTHLMRLEMNQKAKQSTSRLHSVGNESKSVASKVHGKQTNEESEKPSGSNVKTDLGRTQTLFPKLSTVDEQSFVSADVHKDNGFGKTMVLPEAQMEDKNKDMLPDDSDSLTSSRSHSSHRSVEIFLPQVEGDSDVSDAFDVTNSKEDRYAPHSTYNKYGHSGIPDLPESSNNKDQSDLTKRIPGQSEPSGESLHQSDLTKNIDQSESARRIPDQSIPISSPAPGSSRSPELGRRRSVTSQTARSRTSTALSMYSDDFEECPVWDSPGASGNDSSDSSSISHASYHSVDWDKVREERYPSGPIKSFSSPLKSKDFKKHTSSNSNISEEGSLPPDEQSLQSISTKEQFYDSLNSAKSREELNGNEDANGRREAPRKKLYLPKPANDLGYTF